MGSIDQCEVYNRVLLRNDFRSANLHSALSMHQRLQNINYFRSGQCDLLVSTDVAARGLDIPQVDYVISHGLPGTICEFQHRAGRAGRGFRDGQVVALIARDELLRKRLCEEELGLTMRELTEIQEYPQTTMKPINDYHIVTTLFH